jgi:enamine deaminase RidA (YjgF/YER057c/UK114 family)
MIGARFVLLEPGTALRDSNPPLGYPSCKLGPMDIERRLDELGLTLPPPAALPPGVEIPFAWVRVRGNRAFVSGHGALAEDGSPAGPFGKLPSEVTLQEAQHSARLATLAVLASLKTVLGDLDRVGAWLMVNALRQR